MKILRKVSIILLISILLGCFAACDQATNDTSTESETTTAASTEAPTETPEEEVTTNEASGEETTTEAVPEEESSTEEEDPTTEAPTTEEPTSEAPTSEAPTSEAPTSEAPTSEDTTTDPTTDDSVTTEEPTTDDSVTTEEPTTDFDAEDLVEHELWTGFQIITIEKALEICAQNVSSATTERYYICGTIKTISNATYGEMVITDGVNELYVYGSYGADGNDRYSALDEKPYKGDEVLLYCTLQNFNGNTKQAKSAWIIDFIPADVTDSEADYTSVTIAEAREAAVGSKLSVTGVVAAITYANGMIPSGVYIVDGTQSIYVYSADIAQRVSVGNTIKVLGVRENWILSSEANNASKFGYTGCCQLTDAILASNDEGNTAFDKTWIPTSTVKEILNTPVTENITTTIYKVNALVSKVPANGFVNYYFFDLDGETGSYAYTQCSGSDFAWLDEFDGKICTVYLSAINAKSSSTDCFFRFIPVSVLDEGFTFDTAKTAEFVVKYHGVDQFLSKYTGDPTLELTTNIDSELLGFRGATLSYESNNTSVVYFTAEDGKTVMHCGEPGTATVTITGSYNGVDYSETVEITVKDPDEIDYVNVKSAIDADVDEIVYVKGIVGPSLVNKSGFYLIDESGVIAIICESTQFEGLEIGQEVIIKGTRENYIDPEKSGRYGQTCLVDAEIVANFYGSHEYSRASFNTTSTVADLCTLDVMIDYSTTVYVVEAQVKVVENYYYTNTYITDGTNSILLYSSSNGGEYSWLNAYAGQTITVEIAPCNWNDKTSYRGCVLAAYVDGEVIYNELNFTSN